MTSVMDRELARGVRVAPHSMEAEESVLGAVPISSEAADVALERLHPEDFYKPAHQSIFAAIAGVYQLGALLVMGGGHVWWSREESRR